MEAAGEQIKSVEALTYLGVSFDRNMKMAAHREKSGSVDEKPERAAPKYWRHS